VHDQRRSSRLQISVPVEIHGMDATGADILEKVNTKIVSKHGAFLILDHRMLVGSEITLRVPQANRQKKCKVAWVGAPLGEHGPYETGIELEAADNFWGVQFPPDDWEAPAPQRVPVAGALPARPTPQVLTGNNDQHVYTIGAMQRALIAVLEEKGLISPAELAEMLKRLG
jgi:PilZ domain-containing protein